LHPEVRKMAWILLFAAGLFETVWALALKESDGFARLGPTLLFAVALIASMVLLALALRELPVGTGYAVWTGTGAVGAAIAAIILLGEPATFARLAPIALIAVGIVWLAVSE
jgi:quaternary ammonium compound-resistance protein SugE